MGRHSSPEKSGNAKYILIGMLFLILAGSSYLVVNTFFAQQQESTPSTAKKSTSKKTSSKPKLETSETTTASTSNTQQSSESEPQLDATALTASADQVYYGVHYFNQEKDISSNNSAPTISASVIKVFIMEYAFTQADLTEMLEGKTINDWIISMIQQSDNDAANILITHFGMEQLNESFQTQGYHDTRLERLMLDNEARNQGKENYTSLNDCMFFLKKLYQQQAAYPYSTMLNIMEGQTLRTKIPSKLSEDILVANKTGELDNIENDIGLVLTEKNPFAIVVLSQNYQNVEEIRGAIGDFTLAATKMY
ncbi:class A beta-lactamase-related serine hydrolase [Enterococcus hulanensis]|uniref:Class A beta-lactamase-related serine hydrolase n=1 Tax=Enterococcus hulanensis TaxID=2559929 RepID=A0ABU3F0E0_9ENTE|nr:serine hydrolase [Enterococcus hulanensis]MDT2600582.1 class A beta-lactamase-related serine hydrolase [Enterococcus hulanensis]MDT2609680.1 class A beta-lactamase-related serine hydrolase [Enterococcus hulanensis]MDT2617692.1 class A beta-lactamase-related serine hydrolase [Enterococcus hulanensis]MDT2628917.1 class A beta-lactamase-related serine hydrolase [Enterococcus hulanensis]MDT2656257.1 class A beta-lactamase-related serine hydrolase [Enterococcus hulanensis]